MLSPGTDDEPRRQERTVAPGEVTLRRVARILGSLARVVLLLGAACTDRVPPPAEETRGDLVLPDVTVVNPGLDRRKGQTIVVQGDRIASVLPRARAQNSPPSPGRDFDETYVLPGIIDMHVHYPLGAFEGHTELWNLLFLAHGVTTPGRHTMTASHADSPWTDRGWRRQGGASDGP